MQPPLQESVASSLQALDKLTAATSPAESLNLDPTPTETDFHETDWEQLVKEAKAKSTIHAHKHESTCRWIQIITIPVVFCVVLLWLLCTQAVVALVGLDLLKLSDTIMVAYLTTTTVNVIGLLYVILKWLYHTPQQESSKSS